MPVNPQFLTLSAGTWVSICQQRDLRKTLLLCAIGDDVVISQTANTPMTNGPTGPCPAGIYLRGGNSTDTGTPTHFRLSEAIDSDLVHQEWFAQAISQQGGIVPLTDSNFDSIISGNPVAFTVPFTSVPGMMAATLCDVLNANDPCSIVSSLLGALTPNAQDQANDGIGNFSDAIVFIWQHAGGSDTLAVSSGAAGHVTIQIFAIQGAIAVDQVGQSHGNASPSTVTLGAPTADAGEIAILATAWFATVLNGPALPTDWVNDIADDANLGGGNLWQTIGSTNAALPLGTASVVGTWSTAITQWCQAMVTVNVGTAAGSSVLAVFEAFDLPPPINDSELTIQLPRLSRKGTLALKDLLDRINPDEGDANATEDETEYDSLDSGNDGSGDLGTESET